MRRRDFFRNGGLGLFAAPFLGPLGAMAAATGENKEAKGGSAKNIIFMVSDGMSTGTLNMADMLLQRKEGRRTNWLSLYETGQGTRALMDTASASSLVTDSAAASSSWGGGVRVPNGSINVGANGQAYQPILQKFKAAGKSVGCVTTVPITHATPAGFCVNSRSRGDQEEIAVQYLELKFDVMMGGGNEFFDATKRKDKRDVYADFVSAGYEVVKTGSAMEQVSASSQKPLLAVFSDNGLPYTLDANNDKKDIPSLAQMTSKAIAQLNRSKKGFVMQVEGGKVDWAAHSNDAGALLYDQLAFDEAVGVALEFAKKDGNTLLIITTDHGNANPGLFYSNKANAGFDKIQAFKHTNEWILSGMKGDMSAAQVIERMEAAHGYAIKSEEATSLLEHFRKTDEGGLYNTTNLPYRQLAMIQQNYVPVGWGSMDHSGDYVELAMFGPGSGLLKPFVKNFELHNLMLKAAGVTVK